jgi:hypothetical protein
MSPGFVFALALTIVCQAEAREQSSAEAEKNAASPLHALYLADAAQYKIYRDVGSEEMLELQRQPIYAWINPTRDGGQTGDVFAWTYRGRPEVVGSIFSHPMGGQRRVLHEFHSLSPGIVYPQGNSRARWQPKSGAVLKAVPEAPTPAESLPQRRLQLKSLAREFSAYSVTPANGDRWEMRLQTTPLMQYGAAGPDVLGGALFTFVTTAGTDPEVLLLIEARNTELGRQWMFTPARFSDYSLYLLYKDQEIWSAVRGPRDTLESDAQHLYHSQVDRFIPDEVAREN